MTKNRIHTLLDRYPLIRAERQATELFTKMGISWMRRASVDKHDRFILDSELTLLEHLRNQTRISMKFLGLAKTVDIVDLTD